MLARYIVGLKPVRGGGGFEVTVPDFPEIATFGDNLFEAIEMARDAIELVIEDLRSDDEEVPQPRDVWSALLREGYNPQVVELEIEDAAERYNISMTPSLMARVDRAAAEAGVSRSAFIADAVRKSMQAGRAGRGRANLMRRGGVHEAMSEVFANRDDAKPGANAARRRRKE